MTYNTCMEKNAQLALAQAPGYAQWFRENDPDSAGDDLRFETYVRPSGVVDLFVVGDGGGFVSDALFHVGYVTRSGRWVETACGSEELPCEYFEGPAVGGADLTVAAA